MWGWISKFGAWALAHKSEIAAAWSMYRQLRAKRKAEQLPTENALEYYDRTGTAIAIVDETECGPGCDCGA